MKENSLYSDINFELSAMLEGIKHLAVNLANASSLIYNSLDRLNWVGFYIFDGEKLVLGPFQGRPACIEIPIGSGVCGTAAERMETVVVPDVEKFKGHIPCDGASKSEIVIPLTVDGVFLGVLDIDSPVLDRFKKEDISGLEAIAKTLCDSLDISERGRYI